MAKRDEILKNFLLNPEASDFCGLTSEELSQVSFSTTTNNLTIDALKRLITSVEKEDVPSATLKAVNIVLKVQS